MHYKKIFALAGVFLVIALVTPHVALYLQGTSELETIYREILPGHQTSGNASFIEEIRQSRQNTFIIIALVEVVFVFLFVVTMYYGINHIHPTHERISIRNRRSSK